jgi:hypothetical protein
MNLFQLSPTCIFLVSLGPPRILLFVPIVHVSHVHPPLTTRWLNTNTQVNNIAMLHIMYKGHTYLHHIIITIQLFLLLLYSWAGQLAPTPYVVYGYSMQFCWIYGYKDMRGWELNFFFTELSEKVAVKLCQNVVTLGKIAHLISLQFKTLNMIVP